MKEVEELFASVPSLQARLAAEHSFRLARTAELLVAAGSRFFRRGRKTTRHGIVRLSPDELIAGKISEAIDTKRSWKAGKVPPALRQLAGAVTLISSGNAQLIDETPTSFTTRIRAAADMPQPNIHDLAKFVTDNSHGNLIAECVLSCLILVETPIFRNSVNLDALTFALLRYPDKSRMPALQIHLGHGESFLKTIVNAGFESGEAGISGNLLDQCKADVKKFVGLWLTALQEPLGVCNGHFDDVFPRPISADYGNTVIPAIPKTWEWTGSTSGNPESRTPVTDLLSIISECFCNGHSELIPQDLLLTDCMLGPAQLLIYLRHVCNGYAAHIVENGCLNFESVRSHLSIRVPLRITKADAEERIDYILPFGLLVGDDRLEDQIVPSTCPILCEAFDILRMSDCMPKISEKNGATAIEIRVPLLPESV